MSQPFLKKDKWTIEMNGLWCFRFFPHSFYKGDCGLFYLASETPKQQIGSENVPKWYLQLLKLVYVKKKC